MELMIHRRTVMNVTPMKSPEIIFISSGKTAE